MTTHLQHITKRLALAFTLCLFLSHCTAITTNKDQRVAPSHITIKLVEVANSDFKQVNASFEVIGDKTTAFKVISNLATTKEWIEEVNTIQTLEIYDFNNFLVRTVLKSPWPFKQRETITCVSTLFDNNITHIDIKSCSERFPLNNNYVRVHHLKSSWLIKQLTVDNIEVHYQTWLDPEGNVPAFFFNQALKKQTQTSLKKLQQLIHAAQQPSEN